MDRISGALAREIGDEEIDEGVRRFGVLINAQQKIAGAEYLQSFLIYGQIGTGPASQLLRERLQGLARREDFSSRTILKKNCGSSQQNRNRKKTAEGCGHSGSPAVRSARFITLCRP